VEFLEFTNPEKIRGDMKSITEGSGFWQYIPDGIANLLVVE